MKKQSKTSPEKIFSPILKVIRLKECTSTNDYIKDNIESFRGKSPVLITAEHQTKGRGRGNRTWHSLPGKGLYSSFLFRFNIETKMNFLSLAAGISVAESIKFLTGVSIKLKWPNDIEYQGKKIGGILIENFIGRDHIDSTIGIGLNINDSPGKIIKKLSGSATSVFEITGKHFKIDDMNIVVSNHLLSWINVLKKGNADNIREEYSHAALHKTGDKIEFHQSGKYIKGIFSGLDNSGGIIIRKNDGIKEVFYSGEILTLP